MCQLLLHTSHFCRPEDISSILLHLLQAWVTNWLRCISSILIILLSVSHESLVIAFIDCIFLLMVETYSIMPICITVSHWLLNTTDFNNRLSLIMSFSHTICMSWEGFFTTCNYYNRATAHHISFFTMKYYSHWLHCIFQHSHFYHTLHIFSLIASLQYNSTHEHRLLMVLYWEYNLDFFTLFTR